MGDDDAIKHTLQEPLISHTEPSSSPPQQHQHAHAFTFSNGITRSISRRDEGASCAPKWIWGEIKRQVYIAGPMICVNLLQYSLVVVSNMFVGHLGELELASASIASSFAVVTGNSLLIGMASGLETLCGQAYGAKQYHMLGIYLQRAIFVLYMVSLPVAFLWWNMGPVLRFSGQDPLICEMAGMYSRWLLPVVFATATLQPLVKFLQTQSVVLPMALFSVATLCFHIPFCYLLVYKFGVGYRGAAIASGVSNWLNVLLLASYVKYSARCKRTWTSFSMEAFNDLPAFFKLAIPSTVMICLEYWSFEGLVILSGLLPNPQLETSTLSISLTTIALVYTVPVGISASVSTRVSNELGAGRPNAAKASVAIGVGMGVAEGTLMATGLYMGRNLWGWAFTSEIEVADYVSRCMPFLATIAIMDSVQGVLSGVARGCGWQAFGAVANLAAYYLVGLPSVVVLAFGYDLKGLGLWMGMILAVFMQTASLIGLTITTNWQKQAEDALGRVYSSASATLPNESNKSQKDELPAMFEDDDNNNININSGHQNLIS